MFNCTNPSPAVARPSELIPSDMPIRIDGRGVSTWGDDARRFDIRQQEKGNSTAIVRPGLVLAS